MAPRLRILSPKHNKRLQTGWEGFFPYYAGFPELFARELLLYRPGFSGHKMLLRGRLY